MQDQRLLRGGKLSYEVQKDGDACPIEWEQNNKGLDLVSIKYLSFDNVKSVIFTKLDLSTSQKGMHNIQYRQWK